jgi:hypothetical protein
MRLENKILIKPNSEGVWQIQTLTKEIIFYANTWNEAFRAALRYRLNLKNPDFFKKYKFNLRIKRMDFLRFMK